MIILYIVLYILNASNCCIQDTLCANQLVEYCLLKEECEILNFKDSSQNYLGSLISNKSATCASPGVGLSYYSKIDIFSTKTTEELFKGRSEMSFYFFMNLQSSFSKVFTITHNNIDYVAFTTEDVCFYIEEIDNFKCYPISILYNKIVSITITFNRLYTNVFINGELDTSFAPLDFSKIPRDSLLFFQGNLAKTVYYFAVYDISLNSFLIKALQKTGFQLSVPILQISKDTEEINKLLVFKLTYYWIDEKYKTPQYYFYQDKISVISTQ